MSKHMFHSLSSVKDEVRLGQADARPGDVELRIHPGHAP